MVKRNVMKLLFICALIFIQAFICFATTESEEIIEIDGIPIPKKDYEAAMKAQQKGLSEEEQKLKLEMEMEGKQEEKESLEVAKNLPKPCHVCRLFVEDFLNYLEENATLSTEEDETPFKYVYDEHFVYEASDDVCDAFKGYRVTRIARFRYVKEASLLRQVFNQYQKDSKVRHWMYNTGDEDIDDPTGEIRRLRDECYKLKRKYRLQLLDWFENNQDTPLMKWFCQSIYLKKKNQDCLTEEKLPLNRPNKKSTKTQIHTEL